jgi:uncharacterized protein YprB with RNaseH-like and TPR domain
VKLLAFDLECSGLCADFGIILCCGMKYVESKQKTLVLNILDFPGKDLIAKERNLLKAISEKMLEAEALLGHFSSIYDLPFINSRLIYHRLPILPPTMAHIDTWRVARNRLKLRSNRLKTISEFLGTRDEKTAIQPEQWIKAMGGHRPSMNYIQEHCRLDIEVLEEVYLRLRSLVVDHPFRGVATKEEHCTNCGSTKLQKRGWHLTRTRKYQRRQCMGCGAWSRAKLPEIVGA